MRTTLLAALLSLAPTALAQNAPWKPVEGKIMTRWAKDVDPKNPWPEYPRPTMVREKWQNLNGLWDYAILPTDKTAGGAEPDGQILVPFPVESALSGVGKRVAATETLLYSRTFTAPADWRTNGQRVLLHFGAVDWHATVTVNGEQVGEHNGGYDPFSFDITDYLDDGENSLIVAVKDPTDTGGQPRGKQWADPHGIWYTPTTGIWQTAWMEPVNKDHFRAITAIGDPETGEVVVNLAAYRHFTNVSKLYTVLNKVEVFDGETLVAKAETSLIDQAKLVVPNPKPWTPESPTLYEVRLTKERDGKVVDRVKSYVAFRTVKLSKDSAGVHRLFLNGKPTFMHGPLDQGFWPDGLYTPPNEAAMRFDIEAAKKMGCNMLRKHVKVESERFYYLCDTLGLMVWQDIPSPFFHDGKSENRFKNPPFSEEWKANFTTEAREIVTDFASHPSIVMWVPFNEGWGQNDLAWSKSMVDQVKQWDPTRLVNCASGWTDTGNGDVLDIHIYPGPATTTLQKDRAVVLGEYGGLGLPIEGHTWQKKDNWGYVSYKSKEDVTKAYLDQLRQVPLLIAQGLAAAVYTQTTDVEIETNGWLTYDREVWKIDPAQAAPLTKALYAPPPTVKTLLPRAGDLSGQAAGEWRYTTTKPADGWEKPGFDDAAWQTGKGGFGTKNTPGAIIGTEWNGKDIWIRRSFEAPATVNNPHLSIHHDEAAEVYFNGEMVATFDGYTSGYTLSQLNNSAVKLLKAAAGKKVTLAIHCSQTTGGQYIDVGLVDVLPPKAAMGEKPKVYIAKLHGQIGKDFTAESIKAITLEATLGGARALLFDVNAASVPVAGEPWERRFDEFIESGNCARCLSDQKRAGLRTIIWLSGAKGAASILPWGSPELYMRSSAVIGDAEPMYKGCTGEVKFGGSGSSLAMGHFQYAAYDAGYNPLLIPAIIIPIYEMSYHQSGGQTAYVERKPSADGEVLLTDEKDCLTLDAKLALKLGISKGTFDTLPEVLAAAGLSDATVIALGNP